MNNIMPVLEVKARRVGGATYRVPVEVRPEEGRLLDYAGWLTAGREAAPWLRRLAAELMDATNNMGSAVKKKDDTHKMAEANKAFAHYRW